MEDVVDGVALLGSAGLAYATAEEGEVLKAGATAAGLFAAFKGIRFLCEQGDRQTDMAERHQRHQIQKDRAPKGAVSTLHRLNGSSPTSDDARILVTGT